MAKNFEQPKIEVIIFSKEDVITTSIPNPGIDLPWDMNSMGVDNLD